MNASNKKEGGNFHFKHVDTNGHAQMYKYRNHERSELICNSIDSCSNKTSQNYLQSSISLSHQTITVNNFISLMF